MRKILLGTTAVVGAALMGITVAQAQTAPTVRVGGYFDFTAGLIDDNTDANNVGSTSFLSDMEINVIVRGKAANGLAYGATIEVQSDGQGANSTVLDLDEAWGFISSPTLGTVQFGDQDSAANQLNVGIPTLHQSGPSGAWIDFAGSGQYLNSTINDGNDSTKIIYLSPQFAGVDFGVSFAPDGGQGESQFAATGLLRRSDTATSIRNEISGGVRYRGSFGNVGVALGASAMQGDAPNTAANLQNPNAYQVGATLSAFGVTVGTHYVWGKYAAGSFGRTGLAQGLGNSSSLNFGAVYRTGAIALNAFYAIGTVDRAAGLADREQTVMGVGGTYNLAPGLSLYANYQNVSDKNTPVGTTGSRDINMFSVGTRLAF